MKTRLEVILRCNKFKKEHGLGKYQGSVAYFFDEASRSGFNTMLEFLGLLIMYRQNPFIGWRNWLETAKRIKANEQKDKKYIAKDK